MSLDWIFVLILCLVSYTLAQTVATSNKSPKKAQPTEFKQTTKFSAGDFKKQQFYSSKERPELDPVLSALIGEDVKKSIDAKRNTEPEYVPTTANPVLLTTSKSLRRNGAADDSVVVDSIAGSSSEKKQSSRIEIKKGPNGVDYEYEYVYYYYDDDESDGAAAAKKTTSPSTVEKAPLEQSKTTGKTRYTATDRGSNAAPKPAADRNEIPATRGKGRQSIPVVEEVAEERLPAITRFPPRSAITPTVQVISSVEETTKKISVKRPSLDLVDSHSFNRGDKNQSKGSRVVASEFDKSADLKAKAESSVAAADDVSDKSSDESTTAATEAEETTTQVMDKVALDLYAHLANENSNVDSTTQVSADDESATNADSTEGTASTEEFTTAEATTIITTTTSTTTTTPAPTTTTTTTTEAPQVASGRRAPYGSGRNRFKSRPTARPAVSEIPVEVREASPAETSQVKPRNRFSRPSFGGRSRSTTTTAAPASDAQDDAAAKPATKPVSALRGKTRNRFNLRASSTAAPTTEEKHSNENAIDDAVSPTSSTARPLRVRPAFNARGRSRTTTLSSTAATVLESEAAEAAEQPEVPSEKPAALPKPASRFNLRRPNQLLAARGRLSPLSKATAPSTEAPIESSPEVAAEDEKSAPEPSKAAAQEAVADDSEAAQAETTTPALTGLNRLRNRPRLQVHAAAAPHRAPTGPAVYSNPNRKSNPLIARRRNLGSSTTTTEEAPVEQSDAQDEQLADSAENYAEDVSSNAKEEQTEAIPVEVSSESPRALNSLLNRRRPPIRRAGPTQ